MKKVFNILCISAVAGLLFSCSAAIPSMLTDNPVGTKVGKATKKCFICMDVDVSLQTAAKNGGISKISTVDFKMKKGLFSNTYETIVTGE